MTHSEEFKKAQIEALELCITTANRLYRAGAPIISDDQYDEYIDQLKKLDPEHFLINKIGLIPDRSDPRKEKLPIFMGSLNKVKTLAEIKNWLEGKKLSMSEILVATPKYDGLSLLVDEKTGKAWTRGDGEMGLNVTEHFAYIEGGPKSSLKIVLDDINYSYGEAMIPKQIFAVKYSKAVLGEEKGYANPRNMVASLFNSTTNPDYEKLKDVVYIRYGMIKEGKIVPKVDQLIYLNRFLNIVSIPYKVGSFEDFDEEIILNNLYIEWNSQWLEIDGIVFDLGNSILVKQLGRESNNNPAYARAYKGDFEEIKTTVVRNIRWQVSKHGALKPILEVDAINLEGAEVTNITAYNAKYLVEKGIDIGVSISVKRSGKVIPKVIDVYNSVSKIRSKIIDIYNSISNVNIPITCPCCESVIEWDENKVDIYCSNEKCPNRVINRNLAFFKELGVEIGEPSIGEAYKANFQTIPEICNMKVSDWMELEGFAYKLSKIIVNEIQDRLQKATLKELMAASPYFPGLGLRTFNIIDFFIDINYLEDDDVYFNQMLQKLQDIDGIGFVSANAYLYGLSSFYKFLKELPVKFRVWDKEEKGDLFKGMVIVFTGFRDADLEKIIVKGGGKVGTAISFLTTLVLTSDFTHKTSKIIKAQELGIEISLLSDFVKKYRL